jgi:ATP-dependent DNA helicase RecG
LTNKQVFFTFFSIWSFRCYVVAAFPLTIAHFTHPGLKISDLDESLFAKARNLIRSNRNDHPWLTVDNMQMLRDAVLYLNDFEQNKEGFTLAAALLFGKDLTIQNIIIHREYTDATATELIIEEDAVRTLNPNNPRFNGIMDLDNFNPHPKNPNLRRFFMALGWADEIGSGIRNTKKYLPFYVENAKPVFIDESFFRTIIPLVRHTMSNFTNKWHKWLELDEKWLPRLTTSLSKIEIDGQLQKMSWNDQIEYLAPSWIENDNRLALSSAKKSPKSKKWNIFDNQSNNVFEALSQDEKSTNSEPNLNGKVTNMQNKKLQFIITILFMTGSQTSIDDMMDIFEYKDKGKFRQNYLKPLEAAGLITKTNPDKPTASNQKYLITEKGKRFLTGQDF